MASILDLSELPAPSAIRTAMHTAAKLDITICSEAFLRPYLFQSEWSENVSRAKYDNGGGDEMLIFFRSDEAVIKGFDHESGISPHAQEEYAVWPNMYAGLPEHFDTLLDNDDMEREDVTFCTWNVGTGWQTGPVEIPEDEDDGAAHLLEQILYSADEYCQWASEYYEIELDSTIVQSVYEGREIDAELIRQLAPERDVEIALAELAAI